jgi:hypothetical protein
MVTAADSANLLLPTSEAEQLFPADRQHVYSSHPKAGCIFPVAPIGNSVSA